VDFLFVAIELGVTAEGLRANIEWKSALLKGWDKFSRGMEHPPRTILARVDRPVNALQLCR